MNAIREPVVPFEGQSFITHSDWVKRARYVLTAHPEYNDTEHNQAGWNGHHFKALCFDQLGRLCRTGSDFRRADEDQAFPIWWVWPDQIPQLIEIRQALEYRVTGAMEMKTKIIEALDADPNVDQAAVDVAHATPILEDK